LTTTAQQALADAQRAAMGVQHPEVGGSMSSALLSKEGGVVWSVLGKAGAEPSRVASAVEAELGRIPTTSSGAGSTGREFTEISPRRSKACGVETITDQNAEASHEALKTYSIDLTEKAQQGKPDPSRERGLRWCRRLRSRFSTPRPTR